MAQTERYKAWRKRQQHKRMQLYLSGQHQPKDNGRSRASHKRWLKYYRQLALQQLIDPPPSV